MIDNFSGEHAFLSNFYLVPIVFEGVVYPSVEHAYQAAKADPSQRGNFVKGTPAQAKALGRRAELSLDWEVRKLNVMRQLLAEKFAPPGALADQLRATHPHELVEGNWWGDTYWGKCRGRGINMLGVMLMDTRRMLLETDV